MLACRVRRPPLTSCPCAAKSHRCCYTQVAACQKMEVQDACSVLLELVALPRRLLGLHSTVHVSLLQKVRGV